MIARNPADALARHLPKVERREMITLTADQAARLLEGIKHNRVYWPVLIALCTGMRRGEILALRWKNIDLDRGVARVVESLEQTKAALRFKAPKTEKARAITLPSFTVEELRRLKRQQAEELLALGVRQSGETLACCRYDGEPMPPRSLTHEFAKVAGRVNDVPRVRFHDLRHSHATQLCWRASEDRPRAAWPLHHHHNAGPLQPRYRDDAGGRGRQARHGFPVCYKRRRAREMRTWVANWVALEVRQPLSL